MTARRRAKSRLSTHDDIIERGRRALLDELGVDGTLEFLRAVSEPGGRFDKIHAEWQALGMDAVVERVRRWEAGRRG